MRRPSLFSLKAKFVRAEVRISLSEKYTLFSIEPILLKKILLDVNLSTRVQLFDLRTPAILAVSQKLI